MKEPSFYSSCKDRLQCLNPIKTAFDKVQGNNVLVSDTVDAWKTVMNEFRTAERRDWLEKCERSYANAVPDSWFAGCLMIPEVLAVILQNLRKTEVWNGFVNTILTVFCCIWDYWDESH